MRQHLDVDGEHVGPRLDERFRVPIGVRNHQVHVQWHGCHALECLDDRRADCDVRDEVAVHHVDVNEIGPSFFHGRNRGAERRKIGGKNRWGEADRFRAQRLTSSEIGSPAAIWNPADGDCRNTMPAGTPGYGSSPTTVTRNPRVRSRSTARDPETPIRSGMT